MNGLRQLLTEENPLQIVGTINAYTALLAKRAGFRAIYLSGSGVASASYDLPDLGITTGTSQSVIASMQTRDDLYQVLNYHQFEQTLDDLFAKGKI